MVEAPQATIIKLFDYLKKEKVMILINLGSAHNLIDNQRAKKLGLNMKREKSYT